MPAHLLQCHGHCPCPVLAQPSSCHLAPAGLNLNNMNKMLKCAGNDDVITMKADESADVVAFMFESPGGLGCRSMPRRAATLAASCNAAVCCIRQGLM